MIINFIKRHNAVTMSSTSDHGRLPLPVAAPSAYSLATA